MGVRDQGWPGFTDSSRIARGVLTIRADYANHAQHRSMNSMWVIRWVLVALTAALSIALIVRGNLLIGFLVGALAITRAVLVVSARRRRQDFRRRLIQRGTAPR
jgi:hypothetical protein